MIFEVISVKVVCSIIDLAGRMIGKIVKVNFSAYLLTSGIGGPRVEAFTAPKQQVVLIVTVPS